MTHFEIIINVVGCTSFIEVPIRKRLSKLEGNQQVLETGVGSCF